MIFGIGLSKTGTTSLHDALEILGYRSIHYPPAHMMLGGDYSCLRDYEAASDISVSFCFEQLDKAFPGSKFILTDRAEESWLRSCAARFPREVIHAFYGGRPEEAVFEQCYGTTYYQEEHFRLARGRHLGCVLEHFAGRWDDLLILNPCAGDGWERLCAFLGRPIPSSAFPSSNQTDYDAAARAAAEAVAAAS